MRKLLLVLLMLLVGVSLVTCVFADEGRVIKHKFQGYSASTAVSQSKTIYRITGVATGSNAVFGIYNATTLGGAVAAVVAVEGGEATSGDALPNMTFGEDGLTLDTGSTVLVSNCTIIVEYI